MFRATRVETDTASLKNNLAILKKCNGDRAFFCPMIKANAYGHGDVAVAHVLQSGGISAMGVALVEEGLKLRTAGIHSPILIFAPFDKAAASAMFTHQLTPVVGRFEDLTALASLKGKTELGIHLKFNTGMERLGFDESELEKLRAELKNQTHLRVEGLCTHLTHGDEAHEPDGFTARQLSRLESLTRGFNGLKHAHKSSSLATLAEHSIAKDSMLGSRPGISLYGLAYEGKRVGPGLKPVLRWISALNRVHQVDKGSAVSYGARWIAPRRSVIGVVPVGYGDGYPRSLSNRGHMLFRGLRAPVVGTVCMDYTMLDLTDACRDGSPQAGEEVLILGHQGSEEISASELAEKAGTIAYEIVTGIRARVAREVK